MLLHSWSLWRLSDDEERDSNLLAWLLPPLILFMIWRVAKSRRVRRQLQVDKVIADGVVAVIADTDYVLIEQSLARRGLTRPAGLPGGLWLQRLLTEQSQPGLDVVFEQILPLYNRHRFHPQGLSPGQRRDMEQRIHSWLSEFGGASLDYS